MVCRYQHSTLQLLPAGATVAGWVIFLPLDQRALFTAHEICGLIEFREGPGSRTDFLPYRCGHIYRPKARPHDYGARFSEVSLGER